MTAHEIVSMGMVMRGQDFAAAVARGAVFNDLDSDEFDRSRKLCHAAGDDLAGLSDVDILRALGLVPLNDPLSLGAVLLFGTEDAVRRWVPNAEFLFQDLRPGSSSANVRIVAPLLRAAEALRDLIDQRNSVTELMAGMHRGEISLIPSVTRREAVGVRAQPTLGRDCLDRLGIVHVNPPPTCRALAGPLHRGHPTGRADRPARRHAMLHKYQKL